MSTGAEKATQDLLLVDDGSWEVVSDGLRSADPLSWPNYPEALARKDGRESVETGPATVGGLPVEYARFDFAAFGGSMGEVAGERLARSMERAAERAVPFLLHTATGGARMQEGMRALVQMAKVVVARRSLADADQAFIAYLGNPTTGGVLASLAGLADVTIAESGATVGFAGPRVAERFTGTAVDPRSHRAESALLHGLVDEVVDAEEAAETIAWIVSALAPDAPVAGAEPPSAGLQDPLDAWESVMEARSPERPAGHELLLELAEQLVVLRGDRAGHEDPAIDTAVARVEGRRAVVIALDKERAPTPAGYRKARRAIRVAEHLSIPVVTLIDTRGADPSEHSESDGIAWAIAETFDALLGTEVPTLAIVTGEGGSGGALALAVADRLIAYEGSIFSVIGPELAAEILWKDSTRAPEAARSLRLSARDLLDLGIADVLIPEPLDASSVKSVIAYHLGELTGEDADERLSRRNQRWRFGFGN